MGLIGLGEVFDTDPECDPVGDSVIIDSLESISSTVESRIGLNGDVGLSPEGVFFDDEEEIADDSMAQLDSVLEVVGGSASVSDSGNFVLRSVVDEKEEAARVGSIVLGEEISVVGEEILEGLNGDGVGVEGVAAGDRGNLDDVRAAGDS